MAHLASRVLILAALGALAACGREEPAASGPAGGEPADAPGAAAPESAELPPGQQPLLSDGLWVVVSQSEDLRSEMRMCMDADIQTRMSVLGSQMAAGACQESSVRPRPGGGWSVRSVCDMGSGGRVVSEGTVTGDLSSAYVNRMTSTTTGAAVPHMNRTVEHVVEGRREGPCPADMAPGDVIAPGGIRLNMADMAEMAGRMGAP